MRDQVRRRVPPQEATMTDEEFLKALKSKPDLVAVRETIFKIVCAISRREDSRNYHEFRRITDKGAQSDT